MTSSVHRFNNVIEDHEPPRPLSASLIADLVGDQLAERPLSAYIDPLLLCGIVAAIALVLLRAPVWLSWLLVFVLGIRLVLTIWALLGRSLIDLRLLRHGMVVRAHILRVRAARTLSGNINGAYIDCVMPISRGRTSVGSAWLPDISEAERLAAQGRVEVICLPRWPGTWRLLEGKVSEASYDLSDNRPVIDNEF